MFKKQSASTSVHIDIDAIQILEPLAAGNTYDDNDPAWDYVGSWQTATDSSFYGDSLHYSTTAGSYAAVMVNGSMVTLYYTQDPARGRIQVCDGTTLIGTITQTGPTLYRNTWTSTNPGASNHVLKFFYLDISSVDVDAIQVLP